MGHISWWRGSTGVQRYGCIPQSAANNLGEFPQKLGAPNPLFWRVFLGREHLGTRPCQSPSRFGIRLHFLRPHFPSPNLCLRDSEPKAEAPIGSAKADLVWFKGDLRRDFGKTSFPLFEALVSYKSPIPERGDKQQAACKTPILQVRRDLFKAPLDWDHKLLVFEVQKIDYFASSPRKSLWINFFVLACEFCIEKWRGLLVICFFSGLCFPRKRSTKTPQKFRGKIPQKIRGKIRDENSRKKHSNNNRLWELKERKRPPDARVACLTAPWPPFPCRSGEDERRKQGNPPQEQGLLFMPRHCSKTKEKPKRKSNQGCSNKKTGKEAQAGEGKPGGFLLFWGRSWLCPAFGEYSFLVRPLPLKRPRKKKRANPVESPKRIGKIPKKIGKVQRRTRTRPIGKPPRLNPPPPPAYDSFLRESQRANCFSGSKKREGLPWCKFCKYPQAKVVTRIIPWELFWSPP